MELRALPNRVKNEAFFSMLKTLFQHNYLC